jgi:hypothetical protein
MAWALMPGFGLAALTWDTPSKKNALTEKQKFFV